jgi:cholera toxin transcriptional activator
MSQGLLRFERFELDLTTGELHKEGTRVPLQEQPTRLLAFLANRPGELVTREEIHRELWKDGEFVEFEHGVNTAIHKIRVALEDTSESPRIIQTIPRKGYKFIAELVRTEITTTQPVDRPVSKSKGEFVLPLSLGVSRALFLLAQVPYVASYLAAFYNIDSLDRALQRTFDFIPVEYSLPGLLVLALLGLTVRVYLIGLVGWGHTEAGPRYRRLFPYLLPLDALWAATPLLVQRAGPLVSLAGLILMAWLIFGQRTLMQSIEYAQAKRELARQ